VGRWPILITLLVGCQFDASGTGALTDADPSDGANRDGPATKCATTDNATLSLYRFDDDIGGAVANDETGRHSGTFTGTPTFPSGPCGLGIEFPAGAGATVDVPNDSDWDLSTGSVDLWVRVPPPITDAAGVMGRDANGVAMPGHFEISLTSENRLYVRIQNAMGTELRCSDDAYTPGQWIRVGANWGAPDLELWIDGVEQSFIGQIPWASTITINCEGLVNTDGIDGNDNPWVFGASNGDSVEGTGAPVTLPLTNGAIDHVRISNARRDYSIE
jgi:hypothetical protein